MSLTNARELALINNEFGAVAAGTIATLHAGLFTTMPNDAGSGGVEPAGGAYARVAVTNDATQFPSANPKVNANAITFPQSTAAWGTVKGMGWWDAASAGNLRSYAPLWDQVVRMAVGLNTGDIIHAPGHVFVNDTKVVLLAPAGVTLPAGLAEHTEYFVINVAGGSFQLSATQGGSAIAITADGAMMIGRSRWEVIGIGNTPSFAPSGFSHEID